MRTRWATGRTEAFSDGVFAIAITLLVLDLRVPAEEIGQLKHGILHEWPAYLAYATSFITIGGIWLGHHAIFGRLRYVNAQLMRLNLLVLMVVSFLPFPTRLMAEAIRDPKAERTAVIFYGLALSAVSFAIAALWGAVVRDRELLREDVSEAEVRAVTAAAAPNVGLHLGTTALAIVAPRVAAFGYLVIAVVSVARARGDMSVDADAAGEAGEPLS